MLNEPGKGYGIYNVKERIELYYGIECNLECSLVENNYICIALTVSYTHLLGAALFMAGVYFFVGFFTFDNLKVKYKIS